ncbi:hypothetical protein BDP27DRAFT_1434968 [Rhodocollybia butyracea]|uniref:DNA polymerase epsilon subunit D n=1 Tax=Rhodocollybia butyracea TaxID=206335 RepID=A0A9P5P6E8_9AGAR|nr:hypothetical protein BDP27DRAFT_1434968 [Rhodocollybia butyracea]
MSVYTPTLIPRPPLFPRLLPEAPLAHPLPLPPAPSVDIFEGYSPGVYGHLNHRRNLQREMDELSEEESELDDLSSVIQQRGHSFLVPIGKTLTALEEKNDADEDESEESASAASGTDGPPSVMEDGDGENDESEQDLDASMEDLDEEGDEDNEMEDAEEDLDDEDFIPGCPARRSFLSNHHHQLSMPRKENSGPLSAQQQQDLVSDGIDNFELPTSLVIKIAKSAVPDNTKLQKEAILSLVKGSTVFINYLAATQVILCPVYAASDVAQSKQHKSISASDVLKALELIELGDMVDPLTAELQVYRDQVKPDKNGGRRASTASSNQRPSVVSETPTNSTAKSKGKGKEKANGAGPSASVDGVSVSTGVETSLPPFTSAPLAQPVAGSAGLSAQQSPGASESISAAFNRTADAAEGMDVDMEADDAVMEEVDDAVMEEVEEGVEKEEVEPEELQDMVAVEAQEVLEDAKGVEQRGVATEHQS